MNEKAKIYLKRIQQKLIPFLIKYRFGILLAIVVLYIVWPKHFFHRSEENPYGTLAQNGPGNDTSTPQAAPIASLYDPESQNADPKWSLPAELKSAQLQAFAEQVDKLSHDSDEFARLQDSREQLLQDLSSGYVRSRLWPGLTGNGFKDQKLPLDWYKLIKNYYDKSAVIITVEHDNRVSAQDLLDTRIKAIQIRLLGGRVLTGDVLCVKDAQTYFDQCLETLSKGDDELEMVSRRIAREISDPQSAVKDFGKNRFKTLQIGMKSRDLKLVGKVIQPTQDGPVMTMSFDDSDYLLSIGPYPLKSVTAYFMNDNLYRIRLTFEKNSQEIFSAFREKHSECENNNFTCVRNGEILDAQFYNYFDSFTPPLPTATATIVRPKDGAWEEIDLFDYSAWMNSKQFYNPPGELDLH